MPDEGGVGCYCVGGKTTGLREEGKEWLSCMTILNPDQLCLHFASILLSLSLLHFYPFLSVSG